MALKVTLLTILFPAFLANAHEPNYTLPSITYTTAEQEWQRACQRGRELMTLKGIPDGDATLVCTNWSCPTSVVVNAMRYIVSTNCSKGNLEYSIMTTNFPSDNIASGDITIKENEQEALLSAFIDESYTSMPLSNYVRSLHVLPIGLTTNAVFISNLGHEAHLVYKSIHIRYENLQAASLATHALVFMSAIINEGLPAEERIILPPSQ